MHFFRTFCTERECISVSVGDELDADPSHSIVVDIESANSIADEAFGPNVSCELHLDQGTARRFSAMLLAAYIAAAANKPRSELMDHGDEREYGVFLDVVLTETDKISATFEVLHPPPHGGLPSLTWSMELEKQAVAELSEALLSASKIAVEACAIDASDAR